MYSRFPNPPVAVSYRCDHCRVYGCFMYVKGTASADRFPQLIWSHWYYFHKEANVN